MGTTDNIFNPVEGFGSLGEVLTKALPLIFTLVGFLAIIVFAVGALRYIVSRGDAKAADSARGTMTGAVIGFVIVLGSAAVSGILSSVLGLGLFGTEGNAVGPTNGAFDLSCAFRLSQEGGGECVGERYSNPGALTTDILILIISVGAVAFFFMLLWSGIKYMTARGDDKALAEARGSLTNAGIGLLLLIASFVIINLIAAALGFRGEF